ncbi:MAG: hypothetical protein ABSC71_03195 [Candidatus Acidiferrales bacterium]|jgi:hypothetical protein
MEMRSAFRPLAVAALLLLPVASLAGSKFDGKWTTHLSCEAHGESPAYKWDFPSEIKDGNYHGQHGEDGAPGYLVIDGKINDDGTAKLAANGVPAGAHGIFVHAVKGNKYSYNIKAHFTDIKGTGTRDEGVGFVGRACTFEFDKLPDTPNAALPATAAPTPAPQSTPQAPDANAPK